MTIAVPGTLARVLIVADDLTGALDTAGPFAQQGLVTKVVAQPMQCDADSLGGARVVSVNTASRHLPADAVLTDPTRQMARHRLQQHRPNSHR